MDNSSESRRPTGRVDIDSQPLLDETGNFIRFFMEEVNLKEMKKSLLGEDGRKVII